MTQKRIIQLLIALGAFILIVGAGVGLAAAVFVARNDSRIVRVLGSQLPIAKVGEKTITYGDFLAARDTVQVYFASDAAKQQGISQSMTSEVEKGVLDRLVRQTVVEEIAKQKDVSVPDEEVRLAFSQLVLSTSTTMPNVAQYLKDTFHWTEEDFRNKVIRQALLEELTASTYASTTEAASAAFETAVADRLAKSDVRYFLQINAK